MIRHLAHSFKTLARVFATVCVFATASNAALGQTAQPTIVLVHGAWADSSSWNGVIARLEQAGYTVKAPPNTLRGLASDAAVISNYVKSIPGPVVLVGHSYGGSVISVASASTPNVKALVYVDAFVPDGGETVTSLLASSPPPPKDFLISVPFATPSGGDADLYLNPKYFGAVFASAESPSDAALMAVIQRPLAASTFTEKAPAAEGWKSIPSWYVVGDADKVIPPSLQLMMATRAKSQITHVPGGDHPSMIAHPDVTVAAIVAAAKATTQ